MTSAWYEIRLHLESDEFRRLAREATRQGTEVSTLVRTFIRCFLSILEKAEGSGAAPGSKTAVKE